MGLLLFGMLAFILFKITVVMFTSVSGSTIAVLGGVALLLQIERFEATIAESISAHAMILPILVLVPAVIGFILQEIDTMELAAAKSPKKATAAAA